jgi:hypothetical protein
VLDEILERGERPRADAIELKRDDRLEQFAQTAALQGDLGSAR